MRTFLIGVILAAIGFLPSNKLLAGGGPDLYGYRWLDSKDTLAGAPIYAWIDLANKPGTIVLSLQGDDLVSPFMPIGFPFTFYWSEYDLIKIATNGYVSFSNQTGLSLCLAPIPTPGGQGDNFMAPLLGDLTFAQNFGPGYPNPGIIRMWSNQVDSLIVSWEHAPFWRNPAIFGIPDFHGDNSFQMILTGADSCITFQYKHLTPSTLASDPNCASNTEIGIENLTGNVGLAAFSNSMPTDTFDYAIRFIPPPTPGFTVPDPAPVWNANIANAGQFYLPGNGLPMLCGVKNLGNQDLTSTLRLVGKLTPLDVVNILWRDTLFLPNLAKGADTTVQFVQYASLPNPGQYYYTVQLTNPDDVNLSNNANSVEVSIVDVDQTSWHLTYCTLNNPDGAIGWGTGPDYGVGIYVEPPSGNTEILGVDVFVVDFDNFAVIPVGSGFRIQILSKDSMGNPGAVIHTQIVPKDSVISDNWNYLVFDSLVKVDSGGFYVAWLHDGDSISLGTEEFGPISRRSYEILAGNWAPYRDGNTEDFLIVVNMQGLVSLDPGQTSEMSFTVYPNPAQDHMNVKLWLNESLPVTFSLFDCQGNVIWREHVTRIPQGEHIWSHSLHGLANGLYWVQLEAGGERYQKKLCIHH